MLRNRLARVALAAVLGICVLSIGTTKSSAIPAMNGQSYRVIKNFVGVAFQYDVWRKFKKNEAMNHECQPTNGQVDSIPPGYCYLDVARQVFFDNCTVSASDAAECNVGEAQPQGGTFPGFPEEFGTRYVCPKGAIVKTVSNLLFIPRTCHDQIEE
jgi:hypothetical protein